MGGRGTPAYPHGQQLKLNQYIQEQSENADIEKITAIRDNQGMIGMEAGGVPGVHGLKRCACCSSFSIPIGSKGDTCSICGWIDDEYQNTHPKSLYGRNPISLEDARKAYRKIHENDTTKEVNNAKTQRG